MSVLNRTTVTTIVACALAAGSMARYPGGMPHDHSQVGYSFTRNFLSDLGMTVAYNGVSNRLGAALFIASLLTLVAGLGSSLAAIIHTLTPERTSRGWATLAAFLGLLACAAFAGVAVTPENHVMAIHVAFTLWAWHVVAAVPVLLGIATFKSTRFDRRAPIAWAVTALLLGLYCWMITVHFDLSTPTAFKTQVVAQKIATVVIIAGLLYGSREADRARHQDEDRFRNARQSPSVGVV